ncbi:MAG: O-antigen ligase family protein [Polaribacter sp.]|uniref:O-antigen ligase family protein n=1 Tax=Polaribacter sp. TaxID=1920175 RepID=UPI003267D318
MLVLIWIPQINMREYPQSTITSKFLVFSYFCIIFLIICVFVLIKTKRQLIVLSLLDIALVTLLIYISINRFILQPEYSFSNRYIELIELSFVYIVARCFNKTTFYLLLLAIIISGIIQAIYGNLQLLNFYPSNHSGFKITGSFFNPGPYAGFLVSVFPIALGLYLFKEKVTEQVLLNIKKKQLILCTFIKHVFEYIPLIGIISIVVVILATQSRASWLAVLASTLLLFEARYQIIKKVFKQLNAYKKTILIIVTILSVGISLFGIYHFKKGSSDGRLFIWKVSTEFIKGNPIFGVGFDRFKAYYMNFQANYFIRSGETTEALVADNTYYAFNEFVQFFTENGFVGFVLLIIVLSFIIKSKAIKENDYLSVILKLSLLTICVFAFFSYPMQILPIKLVIVVLLASLAKLSINKIILFEKTKIKFKNPILKGFALVGILIVAFFSFNYISKLDNSFKNWKLALISYQYGDYESAIEEYEKAYPELKNNGDFLMNYGKTLSINKQDKKAIEILEQAKNHLNTTIIETALGDSYKNLKQYHKAEIAYKNAANMIPIRFYPLYLLAKLYEEIGQKEKAITMAKTILEKDIKIPSTAIKEIKTEMKKIISNYKQK